MSRIQHAVVLGLTVFAGCSSPGTHQVIEDAGFGDAAPFTKGVSTLAGAAEAGFVDGDRSVARFNNPVNVAVGPDGRIFVADFDNGKLRVVTPDGTTSTLISTENFRRPFGLAFAGDTLFVT